MCGQLYCIRTEIARGIYLPKDLAACDDGFIKTLVCTDFLTRPTEPRRIRLAEAAEHTFEAYASPLAIVKNQKRQIMGQTIVHILVDGYLKTRPLAERSSLAETLQEKDRTDPMWLKRLIPEHLQHNTILVAALPGNDRLGIQPPPSAQVGKAPGMPAGGCRRVIAGTVFRSAGIRSVEGRLHRLLAAGAPGEICQDSSHILVELCKEPFLKKLAGSWQTCVFIRNMCRVVWLTM